MKKEITIILGAGITGLAAGIKTGAPIFEADPYPGESVVLIPKTAIVLGLVVGIGFSELIILLSILSIPSLRLKNT